MTFPVEVTRIGVGYLTETVEYGKEPGEWTDFDINQILGKMHRFIRDRGNRKLHGRVSRDDTMTFFEIESEDGQATVRGGLLGVAHSAVDKWLKGQQS